MTDPARARVRALIIPREHGAWGLLLVPLFTGAAAGIAGIHQVWPVALFTIAVVALFWLRTPAESLLGGSPLTAQTPSERSIAVVACGMLVVIAGTCLAFLMHDGRRNGLLLLGSVVGAIFVAQVILKNLGRKLRMAAEIVGALGLTCTAPATYYVASGQLDFRAWGLWAANWIFAGNQVHFVHLRIHAARAFNFQEKFSQGRWFFVIQLIMLPAIIVATNCHWLPPYAFVAFAPALIRSLYWFFRGPAPLQIKNLGWSEMAQGALFGLLLAVVFTHSRP